MYEIFRLTQEEILRSTMNVRNNGTEFTGSINTMSTSERQGSGGLAGTCEVTAEHVSELRLDWKTCFACSRKHV